MKKYILKFWFDVTFQSGYRLWLLFNGSQLPKMKKSIPDMSLP